VEPVYRRSLPAASRPVWEVSSPALCCEGAEDAAGDAEARWLDWAWFPCGGVRRQQRAFIHGLRSLGRGPDRWAFSDGSISSAWMSFYCGSLLSLRAKELPLALGSAVAARVGASRRRFREPSVNRWFKDLVVILFFLEVLCACRVGRVSSVSSYGVPVFVLVLVHFP